MGIIVLTLFALSPGLSSLNREGHRRGAVSPVPYAHLFVLLMAGPSKTIVLQKQMGCGHLHSASLPPHPSCCKEDGEGQRGASCSQDADLPWRQTTPADGQGLRLWNGYTSSPHAPGKEWGCPYASEVKHIRRCFSQWRVSKLSKNVTLTWGITGENWDKLQV